MWGRKANGQRVGQNLLGLYSENIYLWVDPNQTEPYNIFQFKPREGRIKVTKREEMPDHASTEREAHRVEGFPSRRQDTKPAEPALKGLSVRSRCTVRPPLQGLQGGPLLGGNRGGTADFQGPSPRYAGADLFFWREER